MGSIAALDRKPAVANGRSPLDNAWRVRTYGEPDATISCKGSFSLVHAHILRTWTPWFDNNLNDVEEASLEKEEVWAIDLLISFCYTGVYDWHAANYDRIGTGNVDCLRSHAHMYALAVKLEIGELRRRAREDFKDHSQACCTAGDSMVDAVLAVYCEIELLRTDTVLKKLLVDAWVLGGRELGQAVEGRPFEDLIALAPKFVADLHACLMSGFTSEPDDQHFVGRCDGCEHTGTIWKGATAVRCECGEKSSMWNLVGAVRLSELPSDMMYA